MRKTKDEPRDIPIKFADNTEEAQAESAGEQGAQAPQSEDGANGRAIVEVESVDDQASEAAAAPGLDESSKSQPEPRADLQAQIDALTQEKAALYDQLLRRQAEFENYRKRIERERTDSYQRAQAEVLLELLPVLDNFDRAMASLEQIEGESTGLRHGVELIHKQFKDAMTKLGLQPVESVGQAFDPHLHEAVTIEPTGEHEENTVIEEFQRGYKLGDRLLRPARVKVAASPKS